MNDSLLVDSALMIERLRAAFAVEGATDIVAEDAISIRPITAADCWRIAGLLLRFGQQVSVLQQQIETLRNVPPPGMQKAVFIDEAVNVGPGAWVGGTAGPVGAPAGQGGPLAGQPGAGGSGGAGGAAPGCSGLGAGWRPLTDAAPKTRPIWIYAPSYQDLKPITCWCLWHARAGWCVDELRQSTHWWDPDTAMADEAEKRAKGQVR